MTTAKLPKLPDLPQVDLLTWAKARFKTVPHVNTLRKWARGQLIEPAPEKVGKGYLVHPHARYVGKNNQPPKESQ